MKKLIYALLAVYIVFSTCKKEEGIVTPPPIVINGCMDVLATNYNSSATTDDGSCTFGIVGSA